MGCPCKDPIKKLETRLISRGFENLTRSDILLLDGYIFDKTNKVPTNMEERKALYQEAKQTS